MRPDPMWRSIGAKATGAAHASLGAPCQDAFTYTTLADDLIAIAVADGAGSARFARQGAEISVARSILYLRNVADLLAGDLAVWTPAIHCAFDAARGALVDFATARSIDPCQLATTLQLAVLGSQAYCYGRIGDGGGVARLRGGLVPLAPAPRNVFANETTFLTSAGSEPDVFFGADQVTDCAIFTDGLQPVAMQVAQWQPHTPFFGPLFDFVRANSDREAAEDRLRLYLGTGRFDTRTDDDRALVVSVWTDGH